MDLDHITARLTRLEALVASTPHVPDHRADFEALAKSLAEITNRLTLAEKSAQTSTDAAVRAAVASVEARIKAIVPSLGIAMADAEKEIAAEFKGELADVTTAIRRDTEAARTAAEAQVKAAAAYLTHLAHTYGG